MVLRGGDDDDLDLDEHDDDEHLDDDDEHLDLDEHEHEHEHVDVDNDDFIKLMIVKQTYAKAATWKPSTGVQEKKLAGPCEVSVLKLSAGGGAAAVAVYDAADSSGAVPLNLKWFLDASTTDNDTQVFTNPLQFERGVYMVCEQGWLWNPVVCIAVVLPH